MLGRFVNHEVSLFQRELRVSEDRVGLFIERSTTILAQIPLILSTVSVPDHQVRTAAGALDTIPPANLVQQARFDRSRHNRLTENILGTAGAVSFSFQHPTAALAVNNLLRKSET